MELLKGIRRSNGGTNSPCRPALEGELSVFESPYASGVVLVDIAVKDGHGALTWKAVESDSEEYQAAVLAVGETPLAMTRATLEEKALALRGWNAAVSRWVNGWGLVVTEQHRVALVKGRELVFFHERGADLNKPVAMDALTKANALVAALRWARMDKKGDPNKDRPCR